MVLDRQSYQLPILSQPSRTEGPNGYLLRLAEENLLTRYQLVQTGITYDYSILQSFKLLPNPQLDNELHEYVKRISVLRERTSMVFNEKHARYCPLCLQEHNEWRIEWELYFYDVCHHHGVWLVDQCGSCSEKLTWNRTHINRCSCGASLHYEDLKSAPESMIQLTAQLSKKILLNHGDIPISAAILSTDIKQTQKLIRYLGNYMASVPGRNPLKMKEASNLNYSWPVTTLAAEILQNWPAAFHQSLTNLEKTNRTEGRPSLIDTFGAAYDYVFKSFKDCAFKEIREQFNLWIGAEWRGGVAKRNKRLLDTMLENVSWVPANVACDSLGISIQRLELLIREGTIEAETHISKKERKFTMVRSENLQQVKEHLFGQITMTVAGKLLGIQKRRMRKLLCLIFTDAKKLGTSPGAPWAVSRLEVNRILELTTNLDFVSIPDEDCVSLGHVLKYWTWGDDEIASLIISVQSGEIRPINVLDTVSGIAAWNFRESDLKNWKLKNQSGMGLWLTITQAAKVLGVKEQVTYELVSLGFLPTEVMPRQVKRGTRIKRSTIEVFNENYIFSTNVAEMMGCSSRKVISHLASFGVIPVSGPLTNGARQVLFNRNEAIKYIEKVH